MDQLYHEDVQVGAGIPLSREWPPRSNWGGTTRRPTTGILSTTITVMLEAWVFLT